jgi:hypothetical protein
MRLEKTALPPPALTECFLSVLLIFLSVRRGSESFLNTITDNFLTDFGKSSEWL